MSAPTPPNDVKTALASRDFKAAIELIRSRAGKPDESEPKPVNDAGFVPKIAPQKRTGARIVACDIGEILLHQFPPQEPLLEPWLCRQHLVMVHAARGVGKTHFALGLAFAIAGGGTFLRWRAPKARKTIFIDGEMPGPLLKARLAALVAACPEAEEPAEGFLRIVTPDIQDGPLPDLATPAGQTAFDEVLGDAEFVVLDNLSTLCRANLENEGEAWLPVATWLLKLRREGRAVLIVHHSGKSGTQRGTSRREDILDTVIKLRRPADYSPEQGARFVVMFEKARTMFGPEVRDIECALATDASGRQAWTCREAEESTFDKVLELARLGLRQADIAQELGLNRSSVCRHMQKARAKGLLRLVVDNGRDGDE